MKLLFYGGRAQHLQASRLTKDPKRSHGHPLPDPSLKGFTPTQTSALAKGQAPPGDQLHNTGATGGEGAGSHGSPKAAPGHGRSPRGVGKASPAGPAPAAGAMLAARGRAAPGSVRREARAPGGASLAAPAPPRGRCEAEMSSLGMSPRPRPPPFLRLRFCN